MPSLILFTWDTFCRHLKVVEDLNNQHRLDKAETAHAELVGGGAEYNGL